MNMKGDKMSKFKKLVLTVAILAMTANTFQDDRSKAQQCGMTGFLPKPFDVEQLYRALKEAAGK